MGAGPSSFNAGRPNLSKPLGFADHAARALEAAKPDPGSSQSPGLQGECRRALPSHGRLQPGRPACYNPERCSGNQTEKANQSTARANLPVKSRRPSASAGFSGAACRTKPTIPLPTERRALYLVQPKPTGLRGEGPPQREPALSFRTRIRRQPFPHMSHHSLNPRGSILLRRKKRIRTFRDA